MRNEIVELADPLTPQERLFAMLIVAFGKDSDSPSRSLTRRAALLESGLPEDSHVPDKPAVKAFITMLRGRMEDATERIRRLQEVGVELAIVTDLELLADPQTDSKLRHRIAQDFLDRDPRGRTFKQRGAGEGAAEEPVVEPSESPGLIEFKRNAARSRLRAGTATPEDLAFLEKYGEESE